MATITDTHLTKAPDFPEANHSYDDHVAYGECTESESIGSSSFVPILHGKSAVARIGLFAHVTADLLQLGFYGRPTLQLYSVLPLKVHEAMPIAQVSFWVPEGETRR